MTLQDRIDSLQALHDHADNYHLPPRAVVALEWVLEDLKKQKEIAYRES